MQTNNEPSEFGFNWMNHSQVNQLKELMNKYTERGRERETMKVMEKKRERDRDSETERERKYG